MCEGDGTWQIFLLFVAKHRQKFAHRSKHITNDVLSHSSLGSATINLHSFHLQHSSLNATKQLNWSDNSVSGRLTERESGQLTVEIFCDSESIANSVLLSSSSKFTTRPSCWSASSSFTLKVQKFTEFRNWKSNASKIETNRYVFARLEIDRPLIRRPSTSKKDVVMTIVLATKKKKKTTLKSTNRRSTAAVVVAMESKRRMVEEHVDE